MRRLVHSKVKEALGLDRCFWHMTGAAPIQRETLDFMASLGIDILELYGMSETCGPATMSAAFRFKFGACGFRLQGCELKLDHVEGRDKEGEGEICFRGRHVMMGCAVAHRCSTLLFLLAVVLNCCSIPWLYTIPVDRYALPLFLPLRCTVTRNCYCTDLPFLYTLTVALCCDCFP